jgi:DNA polymerase-3 subunit alpha (Gram-positive type)
MSTMDGINDVESCIDAAVKFGHKGLAITDHGNVQAYLSGFYHLSSLKNNPDFKLIYGLEANMINKHNAPIFNPTHINLKDATYVVFDLETTSLSPEYGEIIEFGAVKMTKGVVIDTFQLFIKPTNMISEFTTNLTGITNEMVKDSVDIATGFKLMKEYIKDYILVAHNAKFDYHFIDTLSLRLNLGHITNPVIDTLNLARKFIDKLSNYRLGTVCKACNVDYDDESAHRADYDAKVTAEVFSSFLSNNLKEYEYHDELETCVSEDRYAKAYSYHVTLLAKNLEGIRDIYRIVTTSHLDYFDNIPRIPKEFIATHRDNILVGTACCNSEIFELAKTGTFEQLLKEIEFYDYVEIQPKSNYQYLVDSGNISSDNLDKCLASIIKAAKLKNKLIVATGDVHHISAKDVIARDVYVNSKAKGSRLHPLYNEKKPDLKIPNQYYKNTQTMLDDFNFLPDNEAYEYVVTNTNKILDQIEVARPIPKGIYPPKIDSSEKNVDELVNNEASKRYGNPLPSIIQERIDKEMAAIKKFNYSVIYYSSHLLVTEMLKTGYLVGSRGSVGSSFIANLMHITEVNPLPAHYYCPHCQHVEFVLNQKDGFDLPTKDCPVCGKTLINDGHNIPFETFLGFDGDKVPDIDLNFSDAVQAKAHDFIRNLFGEKQVVRAGTIQTAKAKKAFGYAKGYAERKNITFSPAYLDFLANRCSNVKTGTGQHPGGMVICPLDEEIINFTPLQYPGDNTAKWMTTHFAFADMHDTLLKFDILGHDDPTMIKHCSDLSKVDPKTIQFNDKKVLSLFNSAKELNFVHPAPTIDLGVVGLPEFTTMVPKGILKGVNPQSFDDLIKVSGLTHGKEVWLHNAEDLLKDNPDLTTEDLITCRDDIMMYLISKGIDDKAAFEVMEFVRKGRGLPAKHLEVLKEKVPEWYLDCCNKINYLFPKAHATAYVMSAFRIGYYKIYYPLEYYSGHFSSRFDKFDIPLMLSSHSEILSKTSQTGSLDEDKNQLFYESVLEMSARGYKFLPLDIYKSQASSFVIDYEKKGLIIPFSAIDGLGNVVAQKIVEARKVPFSNLNDFIKRSGCSKTHIEVLKQMKVLDQLLAEDVSYQTLNLFG